LNVRKKAQDEPNFVIGRDQIPTFEDCPRLPFIDAVCKEILRWHPVTPLGTFPRYLYNIERQHTITSLLEAVPHATTKDDMHAGFFIPKGEPCFLKESA
jgi:hypothetical protein